MTSSETSEASVASAPEVKESQTYKNLYRSFAYFGLISIFGAQLYGFRFAGGAPWSNYGSNLILYGLFVLPHLVMTRPWYKKAIWGNPAGSPHERRIYIAVTNITWFTVLIWHQFLPLPGLYFEDAYPVFKVLQFVGTMGFLLSTLLFFQGITFAMIDGLLGVPGAVAAYSHGGETPLFTEGAYAEVRHPMYRAAFLASVSSLLIHPHMAQLFWVILIAGTFLLFIPVEEAQLIAARGDDYRRYQERTPYRLFKGIW